jgi:hypothetical protein
MLSKLISGLTQHVYYAAKRTAGLFHLEAEPIQRVRYDIEKVDIFVDFVTSPYVTVGLPYGVITTRYSDGVKVEIASTLRQMTDGEVIVNFLQYLKETDQENMAMSNSSYRDMLKAISANTRATLFCVDNKVAASEDGMDDILRMLVELKEDGIIDEGKANEMKIRIHEIRGYLRTNFKLHVKTESKIPTHCVNYALSDASDADYRQEKKNEDKTHSHEFSCPSCQLLTSTFREINDMVETWAANAHGSNSYKKDHVDGRKTDFRQAERHVHELRRHQL